MISDEIRGKLKDIIRGTCRQGESDRCSTFRNLLIESFGASPTVKGEFESRAIIKEKQAEFLKSYAKTNGLLLDSLPWGSEYVTRGGEAKIYLAADKRNVIKVNDGVYYATWSEFLDSLIIHNTLFPNTAYKLVGFIETDGNLAAALSQPFIEGGQAKLEDIRSFLSFNGFENTKRQDYYNREFGLVLEDMHDENVIAREGLLFFIDTVFYILEL
jgi:hypothetical protein